MFVWFTDTILITRRILCISAQIHIFKRSISWYTIYNNLYRYRGTIKLITWFRFFSIINNFTWQVETQN